MNLSLPTKPPLILKNAATGTKAAHTVTTAAVIKVASKYLIFGESHQEHE